MTKPNIIILYISYIIQAPKIWSHIEKGFEKIPTDAIPFSSHEQQQL